MNSFISRALRVVPLTFAVLIPLFTAAKDSGSSKVDPAVDLLAQQGSIPVKSARRANLDNPPVEIGNRKDVVSFCLGRPTVVLRDGSWLYHEFTVDESAAKGTLVVAFERNHVARLSLIGPAAEVALIDADRKPDPDTTRVASVATH